VRYHCGRFLRVLGIALLTGCVSTPPLDYESREALDAFCDDTLQKLLLIEPELDQALSSSIGYMVMDMQSAKVPFIGRGRGAGVIVDNRDHSRSYVEISQFEAGGGLGIKKFRLVIVFEQGATLDKVLAGSWHYRAEVEAEAQEQGNEQTTTIEGKGYRAFRMSEGAAVVSVTIRAARTRPLAL
jgi:lipid-binding SYLF domain-containing protein